MKKALSILMSLAMVLSITMIFVHAEATDITSAFETPAYTLGEWGYEDGVVVSKEGNQSIGDGFCMSDTWIDGGKRVSVSADFTISSGALEFVFAELDPVAPIQLGCLIVNLDTDAGMTKMFTCSSALRATSFESYDLEKNVTYNLTIEFYEDGTIEEYIDGDLVAACYNTGFEGAYIGLGGWNGVGTVKNIKVDMEASGGYDKIEIEMPEGAVKLTEGKRDVSTDINIAGIGDWNFEGGKVTSLDTNLSIGDNVATSLVYVPEGIDITYSGTFLLNETSNCIGLCFSEKTPEDPLWGGIVIFNINGQAQSTNVYCVAAKTVANSSLPMDIEYGREYELKIRITANGDLKAYIDGELVHDVENTGFVGGFLGIFGFNCSGYGQNLVAEVGAEEETQPNITTVQPETDPKETTANTTDNVVTKDETTEDQVGSDNGSNMGLVIGIVVAVVAVVAVVVIVLKKKKS